MKDEINLTNVPALFKSLEKLFLDFGFSQEQLISMDITAGAYLVTNPTGELPRIICALDSENNFRIEYSHILPDTQGNFFQVLKELSKHTLTFVEGEIIDEMSGSILDDFEHIPTSLEDYYPYFKTILKENQEDLQSLKIYLTFSYKETIPQSITGTNAKDTLNNNDIIPDQYDDEKSLILHFIEKRSTRSIQSRHLLELFPKASQNECLQILKEMADQGDIKQAGSWFKLI